VTTQHPETEAIISGIGISDIGRRTGNTGISLTLAAAREAIADAGIEPGDVDGIATMGDTPPAEVAHALGIEPVDCSGAFPSGGLLAPVMGAMVAAGGRHVRHVLVYRTVQMMGGSILPAGGAKQAPEAPLPPLPDLAMPPASVSPPDLMGDMAPLLAAHAYSAANWLAMHCRRHMDLYGTTKEQLGWLAVNSRKNAVANPLAVYRDPITLEDYFASRPVSTPFSLLDCDVPVDGSIAVVISHADHARNLAHRPVLVASIGGNEHSTGWYQRPDFPKMASIDAAAQLWSRTDLTPADIDLAELYDGFTFLTLAWLEALGICGDGESGPFVEGGTRIALDGELPLNTYGGQLSAGRMHGYWVLHEACLQLRGQADGRQVGGEPEVAVVSAGGGPIAGCMLLTR
jgi:acetyl-CoA acetyltransferase